MQCYLAVKVIAALSLIAGFSGCSPSPDPKPAGEQVAAGLPDAVVGIASWDDHLDRPIHRVQCAFEAPFYKMQAEGLGFELAVGFWGDEADQIGEIDFEQADSVELTRVTAEQRIYRYSTLRILPEMGDVKGSPTAVDGRTGLRPTSLAALEEYPEGIELDFEFSCPLSAAPDPAAES